MMKRAGILGLGAYVPEKIVSNEDFVRAGLDTSDAWIQERTGIVERRIAGQGEKTSDLAVRAAEAALKNANVLATEIDLVVLATSTPDFPGFPSTAALVQHRLGIPAVGAFDIAAACAGFNYALTTAAKFVETGACKKVLVIAADCLSQVIDWQDRSTSILFGDGAGAVVLGQVPEPYGIVTSRIFADGRHADILKVEGKIKMNGRAVFKVAVETVMSEIALLSSLAKLDVKDIDYVILHQANLRIIEAVRERLGLKPEQLPTNLQRFGNTSAASIPLVMSDLATQGRLKVGSTLLLIGFGAGFTWGSNVVRWGH